MTRGRRWIEPLLLVVPLLAGVGWWVAATAGDDEAEPLAVEASGPTFVSVDDLVAASDVVVLGEVAGIAEGRTITDPSDPEAGIRTRLVTIEVSEPLVGGPPAVLVLEEEAELLDGTPIVVNGVTPTRQGDRGVFFLVSGAPPDAPYHALVNEQGRYLIAGAHLEPAGDDPLSAELAALGLDGLLAALR